MKHDIGFGYEPVSKTGYIRVSIEDVSAAELTVFIQNIGAVSAQVETKLSAPTVPPPDNVTPIKSGA